METEILYSEYETEEFTMFEMLPLVNAGLRHYDPFREMEQMHRRFFGDLDERRSVPFRTDIRETEDQFVMEAELPGFRKEEIEIRVEGNTLTLSAKRTNGEETGEEKADRYLRRERSWGVYERSFDLEGIDAEHITAHYADGVLTLHLPKLVLVRPEPKKIEIQ